MNDDRIVSSEVALVFAASRVWHFTMYNKWLHRFAVVVAVWTLLLVVAGAW